jgi:hypothetical protein
MPESKATLTFGRLKLQLRRASTGRLKAEMKKAALRDPARNETIRHELERRGALDIPSPPVAARGYVSRESRRDRDDFWWPA